jgi:hypothetical protein
MRDALISSTILLIAGPVQPADLDLMRKLVRTHRCRQPVN